MIRSGHTNRLSRPVLALVLFGTWLLVATACTDATSGEAATPGSHAEAMEAADAASAVRTIIDPSIPATDRAALVTPSDGMEAALHALDELVGQAGGAIAIDVVEMNRVGSGVSEAAVSINLAPIGDADSTGELPVGYWVLTFARDSEGSVRVARLSVCQALSTLGVQC